jgi:hypothetical protein
MTTANARDDDGVWKAIEDEKRRDRNLRRVSIVAWSITFLIVLVLAVLIGLQISEMIRAFTVGMVPRAAVVGAAMPLVIIVGLLSVLIATLSTVGIFLRLRTASLMEIQARLSAIEAMVASKPD